MDDSNLLATLNTQMGYTPDRGLYSGEVYSPNPGQYGSFYADPANATPQAPSGPTAAQIAAQQAYAAEQQRLAQLGAQIDASKTGIVDSGNVAFDNAYNTFDTQARDLATTSRYAQEDLDRNRAMTSLNRMRSINDLVGNVRQGINSGMMRLANMNAADSSAAGDIARLYAKYGSRQQAGIQNQTALKNQEFDITQRRNVEAREEKARQLRMYKDTETQRIGSDVANQLRALDLQASSGGLAGRVAVEQLKAEVVNRGIQRLAEVDARMGQELGSIQAMGGDAIEQRANEMNQAGVAGDANMFNFNQAPRPQMGMGSGLPISELPLYTRRRDDQVGA